MSSVTQRNVGLIQRKNVGGSENSDPDVQNADHRHIEEDEIDHDSKETRLTLMEEVLLLGLKDREVIIYLRKGDLFYTNIFNINHVGPFLKDLFIYLKDFNSF